jgi:hypothetical protein
MSKKKSRHRPIDKLREGAGRVDVNTPGDDSEIIELISTGDRLLIVKGKGIYEIKLADEIDPDRTNTATPNTVQRVMPFGADDPWIGAVILTGHALFISSYMPSEFDGVAAFGRVMDIAIDIAAAFQLEANFRENQEAALAGMNPKIRIDRSMIMPAVDSVEARCKEYLQRADHALRELFRLAQICYPDIGAGGWDSLKRTIDKGPHDIDNFSQFLSEALPFLHLIRNARNCVEHPRPEHRLAVTNFGLDPSNQLLPPRLEIIHPTTPQATIPVARFFQQTNEELVSIVELLMVFLCARKVQSVSGFPVQVMELPTDRRRSQHVKYGYAALLGNEWVPCG